MDLRRLELLTLCLQSRCSSQLSYRPIIVSCFYEAQKHFELFLRFCQRFEPGTIIPANQFMKLSNKPVISINPAAIARKPINLVASRVPPSAPRYFSAHAILPKLYTNHSVFHDNKNPTPPTTNPQRIFEIIHAILNNRCIVSNPAG